MFEESDAVWGLAMARFPLGIATMMRMQFDEAKEIFREGRVQAERSSDPMVKSLIGFGSALVVFYSGEVDEAERLAEQAVQLTRDSGVSWISEVPGKSIKAEILRSRGQLEEAVAVLRAEWAGPSGLYEEARSVSILAEILADLGRFDEAIAEAQAGIDIAGEDVLGSAWCHRAQARALKLKGEPTEAERVLRVELNMLADTDWDEERILILALLAAVLDDQKRFDESAKTLDEARTTLRRFPPGANVRELEELLLAT
jgi:tetratricopeptide (TPR) repeat protein